ncbi:MAG: thioredoxin domain-containing protein [Ferruginibacter sp.]
MLKKHLDDLCAVAMFAMLTLLLFGCKASPQKFQNRLSSASNPYLREHADNPVDWYEWGDAALEKARKENKPLLISIGYAACHWCHQMEEESFMDTAVARVMNENFVCIKVDREERPDIDNLYLHACQLLNKGEAGWPLNAIALPDGKPFFAGTYYTKESWIALLKNITATYKNKYNKVVLQANALTFGIIDNDSALIGHNESLSTTNHLYEASFQSLYNKIDLVNGGFKGQQKFPLPAAWEFVLQYYYHTKDARALAAVNTTLKKMALGGLYDQVGGGFARYTTDSLWRQPHFEKMLCDNAQLISLYTHAYQLTKDSFFKNIASESIAFVERELTATNGGFYCSLNADTKSGEGEFYKWTGADFSKVLNSNDATLVKTYFHVSDEGTAKNGKSILFAEQEPVVFAASNNLAASTFESMLNQSKASLLKDRNKRPKPTVDEKILTAWNGLMMQAYVDAYVAFGDPVYLERAKTSISFLKKHMIGEDGHLWRSFVNDKATVDGFLDDYAFVAKALVRLYEVTFDKECLLLADKICTYVVRNFYDAKSNYFFYNANGSQALAVRKIELFNNIIPSSNAVMAEVLSLLGTLLEKEDYLRMAKNMSSKISSAGDELSFNSPAWMKLIGGEAYGSHEVAIMGKNAIAMNLTLQKSFLPGSVFMGGSEENLPLLNRKLPVEGTLIYVCMNKMCLRPTSEVAAALTQLERK